MDPKGIAVGVVGLGLMGCGITTCLLMAGHTVVAVAPIPSDMQSAESQIRAHLKNSFSVGLISQTPDSYFANVTVTEDYGQLEQCRLVIECTIEDFEIKKFVYSKIEAAVPDETVITSNTSAIPINILQRSTHLPGRFLGLHLAEPSHTTRFAFRAEHAQVIGNK